MRMLEAQRQLFEDTKAILKNAGLRNGLVSDKKSGVPFYPARKANATKITVDTFVTYDCYYVAEAGVADKEPHSQIISASIDVFTKLDRTSKSIMDLLQKIEDAAFALNYKLEMKTTDSFDKNNEIEHLSYDITKRLS